MDTKIADLHFYFDQEKKTRVDIGGTGNKFAEIQRLKDGLLRLPDADFEAIMRMFQSVVDQGVAQVHGTQDSEDAAAARAKALFDSVRNAA